MPLKIATTTVFLALLLGACVPSYQRKAPLSFAEIPYTGVEGQRWPSKRIALAAARDKGKQRPIEINYVELGEGERTLLFIHGLGSYLKFWRYQLDHFAQKGYRVVALDLPGYGKSAKPASFPYTMEAMADVVRELMRALKIEKPVLVGHSMGGQTALSFAIRYPEEVAGVVLVSPAGFEHFSRKERAWFEKVVTTRFIKSAPEYAIWGSVRRGNFYRWKDDYQWLVEERVRLAKNGAEFDRYAYANVRSIAGLADNGFVRERAGEVKAPTLIVYGDKDRLIPNAFMHGGFTRRVMKDGHGKIPKSELVELQKCGHTLQIDCSAEFNEALRAYLERLPKAAAQATKQSTSHPTSAPASAPTR